MAIDPVSLAITFALNAATMAITASRTIEGPRLSDLSVSVADYGTPIASFVGKSRLECSCFFAEPIREERKKSKGKGGKYKEYTYFGTWASLITDHEIDKILTIYFDHHEIYDELTGFDAFDNDGINENMAQFFLGLEDQVAPERMVAYVEAEEGVNTCPDYLGIAYVFFEDVPLGSLGNRFPQVSVVAINYGVPRTPYEVYSTTGTLWSGTFIAGPHPTLSRDGRYLYIVSQSGRPEKWDFKDKVRVAVGSASSVNNQGHVGVFDDGTLIVVGVGNNIIYQYSADLQTRTTFFNLATDMEEVRVLKDGAGVEHWIGIPYSSEDRYYIDGVRSGTGNQAKGAFVDRHGDVWVVCYVSSTSAKFIRQTNVGGSGLPLVVGVSGLSGGGGDFVTYSCEACHYKDANTDHFVLYWGSNNIYTVDSTTGAIIDHYGNSSLYSQADYSIAQSKPSDDSFWVGNGLTSHQAIELSKKDLSVIQTRDLHDWLADSTYGFIYSASNDVLVCFQNSSTMVWRYLSDYEQSGVTLRDLMELLSERVGMAAEDYDYSELDQPIYGYSWVQGAAKDIAAPALDIHDSDVRPSGFVIEGKKRGQPALGDPLHYEWFVREEGPIYTATSISDTDLPRRVTVTFADLNAELQPNSAIAMRTTDAVGSRREMNIDLTTMSLEASTAQPLVERFLRRNWVGALHLRFALTPLEFLLDPGDVKDITLEDDITIRARIVKITRRVNRVMSMVFEQDEGRPAPGEDPASAVNVVIPSPGAEAVGRPPVEQFQMVASEGFFIDAPMASDDHDQTVPFMYLAAGPISSAGTWPGAEALHSDAGVTYDAGFYTFLGSTDNATWADCVNPLLDALSTVIDEFNVIYVNVYDGELTSITQDEMDADPRLNQALVGSNTNGWEFIQFRDATLQSATGNWRQYALSGFYRGCRGTEQFTGTHAAGDRFLLVDSTVKRKDIGSSEIGDTDYYKAVSAGFDPDEADTHTVAFEGNSHRPYAPWNLVLHQDGDSFDWQIRWDARSRIGGANYDGNDVPTGEVSELYRVRIMDGATIVETYETTSPELDYTAAQQITDWGGVQSGLSVEVVQVSPNLNLEGFTATAER